MGFLFQFGFYAGAVLLLTACAGSAATEATNLVATALPTATGVPSVASSAALIATATRVDTTATHVVPAATPPATPAPSTTSAPITTPIPTEHTLPNGCTNSARHAGPGRATLARRYAGAGRAAYGSAGRSEPSPAQLRYMFPVQDAEVRYVDFHHDYPAADIECPIGSRFVAVTGGVVDFVGARDLWSAATDNPPDRGGLAVAIVGDDGVRYYGSHLSEIAAGITPGVRVEAGQLLGLTGNTGNAGRPEITPHLHFGISPPGTPDDWRSRRGTIRPYEYLQAWERGENVTPELE